MLIIVASYDYTHFQGKIMNRTREDGRTPSFGPNFGQNLVPKKVFVGITSTIFYELLQAIIVRNIKEN